MNYEKEYEQMSESVKKLLDDTETKMSKLINDYNEMIELRRKLKKQREQEVYRKRELKRSIIEGICILILGAMILCGVLFIAYLATR